MLTEDEREAIRLMAEVWNLLCRITGPGPSREGDLQEACFHVHALQRMVGAQAAARAYPGEFRLLGYMTEDG